MDDHEFYHHYYTNSAQTGSSPFYGNLNISGSGLLGFVREKLIPFFHNIGEKTVQTGVRAFKRTIEEGEDPQEAFREEAKKTFDSEVNAAIHKGMNYLSKGGSKRKRLYKKTIPIKNKNKPPTKKLVKKLDF